MPAIRSQTVLSDGYELDTNEYGKRRIQFEELGGNQVRLTAYVDDVQSAQTTLANPSLIDIYTWVGQQMFPGASISVDGKTMNVGNGSLYVSWHVIQRNPLQLNLLVSNDLPPDNWWQQP